MHRGIDPSRDGDHYILDAQGVPFREPDLEAWVAWMQTMDLALAETQVSPEVRVATHFLGTDPRRTKVGAPELWGTMIFGGHHDLHQERYTSRADALKGHEKAVALAKDQSH